VGAIPAFLLERLYVKGSLDNTATGFVFAIRNALAPGTIVGLAPLQIDDTEYPLEKTTAVLPDGTPIPATEVSAESPVRFAVGDKVIIQVEDGPLQVGFHRLIISPKTKEAGTLKIHATDTID
jgi:hypothetical protein